MANFISTSPNLLPIIILAVFALFFIWLVYLTFLVKNYLRYKKQILDGIRKRGLDDLLEEQSAQIKKLNLNIKELQVISGQLSKIAAQSITRIGFVRYNPFGDVGGDQSFSIALLNNDLDGLVISSLHGREGTRVYSKPIKKGKSEYHLSNEEVEAIKKAEKAYQI